MRFAVEAWDPGYGSATSEDLVETSVEVDPWVECAEAAWAPRDPASGTAPEGCLRFVDGVRRIEAHVWVTPPGGQPRPGICASYAAGVVCCEATATLEVAEVRRALYVAAEGADDIVTPHGTFALHPLAGDDPTEQTLALQRDMASVEVEVACGGGPVVVDGPLKAGQEHPGLVGYVKTHRTRYGPPAVQATVGALGVGQRSPILLLGGPRRRYTWYLRLPGPLTHAWAGVVRMEATASGPVTAAAALADRMAVTLPRFASGAHKDARAPQNLYPIAGLERELRRRLGDPQVMLRALRTAAATAGTPQTPELLSEPGG